MQQEDWGFFGFMPSPSVVFSTQDISKRKNLWWVVSLGNNVSVLFWSGSNKRVMGDAIMLQFWCPPETPDSNHQQDSGELLLFYFIYLFLIFLFWNYNPTPESPATNKPAELFSPSSHSHRAEQIGRLLPASHPQNTVPEVKSKDLKNSRFIFKCKLSHRRLPDRISPDWIVNILLLTHQAQKLLFLRRSLYNKTVRGGFILNQVPLCGSSFREANL